MDAAASSISTAFNHSISTYVDPISGVKQNTLAYWIVLNSGVLIVAAHISYERL